MFVLEKIMILLYGSLDDVIKILWEALVKCGGFDVRYDTLKDL